MQPFYKKSLRRISCQRRLYRNVVKLACSGGCCFGLSVANIKTLDHIVVGTYRNIEGMRVDKRKNRFPPDEHVYAAAVGIMTQPL